MGGPAVGDPAAGGRELSVSPELAEAGRWPIDSERIRLMILRVNGQDFVVDSVSDLCAHVVTLRQAHWSEVELYEADDPGEEGTFFGLTMLTHDARALLVYFRYSGDSGFTSRDPA